MLGMEFCHFLNLHSMHVVVVMGVEQCLLEYHLGALATCLISIHSQQLNILPTYDWVYTLIGILDLEIHSKRILILCTSGIETSSLASITFVVCDGTANDVVE